MEYGIGMMAGKVFADFFKEDCSEISKVHTKAAEQMHDQHLNDVRFKYQQDLQEMVKSVDHEKLQHN